MTEQLEEGYRALGSAEVADVDDGRHEVVVDFPHEVMDDYRTDWARGCWDESLTRSMPPMVWNHDPSDLIGRAYRSENLGDKTRLVTRFSDFDAVPRAKQAFAQIRDGDVPGFSFHYRQARSIAHPNVRGARRFVTARMMEHSPVMFPSIPGAQAVGIRSNVDAPALEVPSIDEILRLEDRGVFDADGVRALIAEHYPALRDHIRVVTEVETADVDGGESGERSDEDETATDAETEGGGEDEDSSTLASAVDAALDEAAHLLDGQDLRSLPDPVQQAIALVQAAGVAVDELLDVMGIDDPDSGDRAQLSSSDMNDLPDSAFAYIESGGMKDGSGKTMPRSKRHFPVNDAAHARNALAQASKSPFGDKAMPKIVAAAKKFGIETGKRSDDGDEQTDAALDADLARVQDRLARFR